MAEKQKHDRPDPDLANQPIKRSRISIMGQPDGFSRSPPHPKPKSAYKPPSNLNFKSAFDGGDTFAVPSESGASSSSSKKTKNNGAGRLRVSALDSKQKDTVDHDMTSPSKTMKTTVRQLKPPIFSTPPRPKSKTNLGLQPPSELGVSIFKRINPVSLESIEPIKPKSLRQAHPPPPPIIVSKPLPNLKPLPPPPLPSPSKKGKGKETSQHDLRTISTTHIALATDLTSQAGSASLLSIFLQGNRPYIGQAGVGEGEDETEVRRGVGVSPVKGGGKARGFTRNGLAERATNFLSRSQTAFTLWHKETQSSLVSSSRRPTADLHLRILNIMHQPSPSTHSRSSPPLIALCRIIKKNQDSASSELKSNIYPVLFSFLKPKSSATSTSTSKDCLEQGKEVYVWKPWHIVQLPEPGIDISISTKNNQEDWGFIRGMTQFEIGKQAEMEQDGRIRTALLCSRFFVART